MEQNELCTRYNKIQNISSKTLYIPPILIQHYSEYMSDVYIQDIDILEYPFYMSKIRFNDRVVSEDTFTIPSVYTDWRYFNPNPNNIFRSFYLDNFNIKDYLDGSIKHGLEMLKKLDRGISFDGLSMNKIPYWAHPLEYNSTTLRALINAYNFFTRAKELNENDYQFAYLQLIYKIIISEHVTFDKDGFVYSGEKMVLGTIITGSTLNEARMRGCLFIRKCENGCEISEYARELYSLDPAPLPYTPVNMELLDVIHNLKKLTIGELQVLSKFHNITFEEKDVVYNSLSEKIANGNTRGNMNEEWDSVIKSGNLDRVEGVYAQKPITRDELSYGLQSAIFNGFNDIALYLIRMGADVNLPDLNGTTAVMDLAKNDDSLELLRVAIEHNGNLEARDNSDWTPLMYAVLWDRSDSVRMLLDYGADPHSAYALSITKPAINKLLRKKMKEIEEHAFDKVVSQKDHNTRFILFGELCKNLKGGKLSQLRGMAKALMVQNYSTKNKEQLCNDIATKLAIVGKTGQQSLYPVI